MAKSNGNTFSFIPHVCYFSYHPSIAASETRSLKTLFPAKNEGRGNTVTRTSTYLVFKSGVESIRHHYCMLVK